MVPAVQILYKKVKIRVLIEHLKKKKKIIKTTIILTVIKRILIYYLDT